MSLWQLEEWYFKVFHFAILITGSELACKGKNSLKFLDILEISQDSKTPQRNSGPNVNVNESCGLLFTPEFFAWNCLSLLY